MRFNFRQIISSLPANKNSKSSWWVKLWVRRVSFLFTWLFINMGFSSNAVSCLSIFVSLLACVGFVVSTNVWTILGVILINFWLVLDCVDGNIARCMKQKKTYGEFIDAISGYYTVGFVYLAIGVVAYHRGGYLFSAGCEWLIIFGAISSLADILSRLIYTNYCSVKFEGRGDDEKALTNDRHSINYLRKRVSKEFGISGMFMPFVIVGYILNCYDLVVLFYLFFNSLALLSTTVMYVYKANKYDRRHVI